MTRYILCGGGDIFSPDFFNAVFENYKAASKSPSPIRFAAISEKIVPDVYDTFFSFAD